MTIDLGITICTMVGSSVGVGNDLVPKTDFGDVRGIDSSDGLLVLRETGSASTGAYVGVKKGVSTGAVVAIGVGRGDGVGVGAGQLFAAPSVGAVHTVIDAPPSGLRPRDVLNPSVPGKL